MVTWGWRFAFGVLVALALGQRVALLSAFLHPFYTPDSSGYIFPAHDLLDHGWQPVATFYREAGYPIFVAGLLQIFGSYQAVGIAQLILSLITPLLVWAAWQRSLVFTPAHLQVVHRLIGLLLLAILLFHGGIVLAGTTLGPEILLMIGVALQVWLLTVAMTSSMPWVRLLCIGGAVFLAATLATVRPHWLMAGGMTFLFAAWLAFRSQSAVKWRVLAVAAPLLLAIGVAVLPNKRLMTPADPRASSTFLPVTLACWHLPVVLAPMRQAIEQVPEAGRQALMDAIAEGEASLNQHESYPVLGWDADYCMYLSRLPALTLSAFGQDGAQAGAFLKQSFIRGVLNRPLWYAAKVWREWKLILGRPMGYETVATRFDARNISSNNPSPSFTLLSGQLASGFDFHSAAAVPLKLGAVFRAVTRRGNDVFLGLLLAAAVLTGWRCWQGKGRDALPLSLHLPAVLCWAGISLTCALVHSLEVSRYVDIQVPATVLSLGLAMLAVAMALFPGRQDGAQPPC